MKKIYFIVVFLFSSSAMAATTDWFQIGACIYNDIYLLGMDKAKEKHGDISFEGLSKEDAFEAGTGFGNRQATLMMGLQYKGQSDTLNDATRYAEMKCSKVIGFKNSK